jgi:hypothetical protein
MLLAVGCWLLASETTKWMDSVPLAARSPHGLPALLLEACSQQLSASSLLEAISQQLSAIGALPNLDFY